LADLFLDRPKLVFLHDYTVDFKVKNKNNVFSINQEKQDDPLAYTGFAR